MSCKKYKSVRFPIEAYNNFSEKKRKMEETARQLLGTNVDIPMTRIVMLASRTPLNLQDTTLVKITKKRRVRRV